MNFKSKPSIILIIILAFSLTYLHLMVNDINRKWEQEDNDSVSHENVKMSALSGKIHIDNNWSAAETAGICTGSGNNTHPYVIEDLIIDVEGQRYGLFISNSIVYFKIENCTVNNSGIIIQQYPHYGGIHLLNVSNSQLINNTVTKNFCGIFLEFSNNNIISENIVYDNDYTGINVVRSDNNKILGNTAINNEDHGIYLGNTQLEIGPNKISSNNIVSGNIVNNNGGSGLYMAYSDNNNISGNIANNNYRGLRMNVCIDNNISGNTADNNYIGISLLDGRDNTISKNRICFNEYGIFLSDSEYNTVSHNIFIKNDICVFEEECIGNIFEHNYCFKDSSFELNILVTSISGGAMLGVTLLLVIQKRKKKI